MSARLPSTYQDPKLEQVSAVGREDLLAMGVTTHQDAEYHGKTDSLFAQRSTVDYRRVRNYHIHHKDVSPRQGTTAFGQEQTFHFGHEGPAMLIGAELIFTLPALNGDNASANMKWAPYIAEQLIGDQLTISYSTNQIRRYGRDFLHFYRRLASKAFSTKDAAYKRRVGANLSVADSAQANTVSLPIWLPNDGSVSNGLLTSALPEPLQLTFTIPARSNLIRRGDTTDGTPTGTAVVIGSSTAQFSVTCKLRLKYVELAKAERIAHARHTIVGAGATWLTLDNEGHENETFQDRANSVDAGVNGIATKTLRLFNIKNPATMLFGVVRYNSDIIDALQTSTGATSAMGTAANDRVSTPDRFAAQPYLYVELKENGSRWSPQYSYQYIEEVLIPELFECEMGENIFVIPFSLHPLHEADALGHKSIAAFNNPEFVVACESRPSQGSYASAFGPIDPWCRSQGGDVATNSTGQTAGAIDKRLDVWGLVRNKVRHHNGEMLMFYN